MGSTQKCRLNGTMLNTKACRFWWRGKCMLDNKKPCVHTLCPDWESKYIYPVRETWVKEK